MLELPSLMNRGSKVYSEMAYIALPCLTLFAFVGIDSVGTIYQSQIKELANFESPTIYTIDKTHLCILASPETLTTIKTEQKCINKDVNFCRMNVPIELK